MIKIAKDENEIHLWYSVVMKKCRKCGWEKPLSDFPQSNQYKDGRRARCNECVAEDRRNYYYNSESFRVYLKNYNKEYYDKNREVILAKQRESYRMKRERDGGG